MRWRCGFSLVVAMVLLLAACSGEQSSPNEADVMFANAVVESERTSAPVATLLRNSAAKQQVQDLGAAIAKSQTRYADRGERLLQQWHEDVAAYDANEASTQLKTQTGSLDRNGLQVLLARHQAIVAMCQAEIADGQSNSAKRLARDLIAARNAEKGQIEALLEAN